MKQNQLTAYMLMVIFAFMNVGGAVAHFCFDGAEPPVSLHFESIGGHIEHESAQNHVDTEREVISDNLVTKNFDTDFIFILAAVICSLLIISNAGFAARQLLVHSQKLYFISPPLRAPPLYS